MLSVAENEADRTSERIKVIMDWKVAKGEHLGPKPPLGYTVVDKHFVIVEEDAEIARGTFRAYQDTGKIYAAMDYLHQHGVPYIYSSVMNMLSNPLYAGRCRDNPNYCPPIIPPEEFDRVQEMLKARSIRHNPTKREYIFSGMIRCARCGYKMTGLFFDKYAPSQRYRYRCDRHSLNHLCDNGVRLREIEVEEELLVRLEAELQNIRTVSKPKAKPKKPKDNAKKLERLNELYVEGIITKEQFQEKRRQLTEPPAPPEPDLSTVRHLAFSDNVRESYAALSREERRMLWRSIVESITADGEHLTVTFRSLW